MFLNKHLLPKLSPLSLLLALLRAELEAGMDDLIKALTVPFAAGFVVQRLEIADPYTTAHIQDPLKKTGLV